MQTSLYSTAVVASTRPVVRHSSGINMGIAIHTHCKMDDITFTFCLHFQNRILESYDATQHPRPIFLRAKTAHHCAISKSTSMLFGTAHVLCINPFVKCRLIRMLGVTGGPRSLRSPHTALAGTSLAALHINGRLTLAFGTRAW